jgi:hypothetical protein
MKWKRPRHCVQGGQASRRGPNRVRPGSRAKLAVDIAAASENREYEAGAFDGVYTVVSTVQGGPETIVNVQLNLLRAASAASVRRFIPSDYSLNRFGLAEGENPNSDWRRSSRAPLVPVRAAASLHEISPGQHNAVREDATLLRRPCRSQLTRIRVR